MGVVRVVNSATDWVNLNHRFIGLSVPSLKQINDCRLKYEKVEGLVTVDVFDNVPGGNIHV